MRGVAPAARRRTDRPVPISLARRDGDARRGFLAHDGTPHRGRQSTGRGRLELRRRVARALRGDPPRGFAAAAVLPDPARGRGAGDSLVRGARDRRHRLQPDAVGSLDGRLYSRARRGAGSGRLAPPQPQFQQPALDKNVALRDALKPIARRHGTTASAVAVAWTLAWPGVTGAIVGARTAAQVDGWIGAATLDLTAADLDEIAAAITRTGAGTGPTRPAASEAAALSRGPKR